MYISSFFHASFCCEIYLVLRSFTRIIRFSFHVSYTWFFFNSYCFYFPNSCLVLRFILSSYIVDYVSFVVYYIIFSILLGIFVIKFNQFSFFLPFHAFLFLAHAVSLFLIFPCFVYFFVIFAVSTFSVIYFQLFSYILLLCRVSILCSISAYFRFWRLFSTNFWTCFIQFFMLYLMLSRIWLFSYPYFMFSSFQFLMFCFLFSIFHFILFISYYLVFRFPFVFNF